MVDSWLCCVLTLILTLDEGIWVVAHFQPFAKFQEDLRETEANSLPLFTLKFLEMLQKSQYFHVDCGHYF